VPLPAIHHEFHQNLQKVNIQKVNAFQHMWDLEYTLVSDLVSVWRQQKQQQNS